MNAEWKMLTEEQKGRFNIPADIQKQLRSRGQMDDVEILRQLVLTQKLPPSDDQTQFGDKVAAKS